MKTTMKKLAAMLLAMILVLQVMPVLADQIYSSTQGPIDNYRDKLQVTSPSSVILVGTSIDMSATAGYTLKWESKPADVAEVDAYGRVTAIAPGIVRITASEGSYKDSVILQVVEKENTSSEEETMTIVINGNKEKITYDGKGHELGYTASSSSADFSADLVKMTNEAKKVVGTDCGVYQSKFEASDFIYEGNANAEFIVSDGWMQIRPATVVVRANSAKVLENRGDAGELSATVENLPEGTDASVIHYDLRISNIGGVNMVEPYGEQNQGNFKVSYVPATTETIAEHDLYNIAEISGKYYRLKKSKIWSNKEIITANAGAGKIKDNEYTADPYDFTDLTITIDGVDYVYKCNANADAIVRGANYYEVKSSAVTIVMNKIGAMDGSNPRWLITDGRYDDPNNTSGFHRDFKITLHKNEIKAEDQTAYNMLSINDGSNYYKLRSTTITAKPLDTYKTGVISDGEYYVKPYDFTNVVLTIDGEEYKYSPVELTGEYDNYYTVSFKNVERSERFNGNAGWFANKESWLDGAYDEYGTLPNNTASFHVNYVATTHKAVKIERKVSVTSDWPEGEPAYIGTMITMRAELTGFDNVDYTLQWQYTVDNNEWFNEPGANGTSFTFELNETTVQYTWRVVVNY